MIRGLALAVVIAVLAGACSHHDTPRQAACKRVAVAIRDHGALRSHRGVADFVHQSQVMAAELGDLVVAARKTGDRRLTAATQDAQRSFADAFTSYTAANPDQGRLAQLEQRFAFAMAGAQAECAHPVTPSR